MGELLGRLADRSFAECGLVISASCKYTHENDAGDGFSRKELMLRLIPEALYKNKVARWEWWATDHVEKVRVSTVSALANRWSTCPHWGGDPPGEPGRRQDPRPRSAV